MKIRKVLAVVFAMVLMVGVMNTTKASAQTIKFDKCKCDWFVWNAQYSQIQVDLYASGFELSEIYDVRMTLKIGDMPEGCGGGYVLNSENGGWDQREWGNEGAGKAITLVSLGDDLYTVDFGSTAPLYTEPGGWAQVVISAWWGPDFEVVKCELIGADGKVLAVTPAAAPIDVIAPAPGLPKTGIVSSIVLFFAGACMITGGAVITRKNRKEE